MFVFVFIVFVRVVMIAIAWVSLELVLLCVEMSERVFGEFERVFDVVDGNDENEENVDPIGGCLAVVISVTA